MVLARFISRFILLLLPRGVSQFLIARPVTDFSKQPILSAEEKKKDQQRGKQENLDSQTEEEVKANFEKAAEMRAKILQDGSKLKLQFKDWREEKQWWEYFYLQGIKTWRSRGVINRPYETEGNLSDLFYFPRIIRFKRRLKRFSRAVNRQQDLITKYFGEKIQAQNTFKCPPITESQAYQILNMEPTPEGQLPDLQIVWERYVALMTKNSTLNEGGGSSYMESKVQTAKDFLMEKHPDAKVFQHKKNEQNGLNAYFESLKENTNEIPEWFIHDKYVQLYSLKQAKDFDRDLFQEEIYEMPIDFEYRYWMIKKLNIQYRKNKQRKAIEDKKKLEQEKKRKRQERIERIRKAAQARMNGQVAQGEPKTSQQAPAKQPEPAQAASQVRGQTQQPPTYNAAQELQRQLGMTQIQLTPQQQQKVYDKVKFLEENLKPFDSHFIQTPQQIQEDEVMTMEFMYDDSLDKTRIIYTKLL